MKAIKSALIFPIIYRLVYKYFCRLSKVVSCLRQKVIYSAVCYKLYNRFQSMAAAIKLFLNLNISVALCFFRFYIFLFLGSCYRLTYVFRSFTRCRIYLKLINKATHTHIERKQQHVLTFGIIFQSSFIIMNTM